MLISAWIFERNRDLNHLVPPYLLKCRPYVEAPRGLVPI